MNLEPFYRVTNVRNDVSVIKRLRTLSLVANGLVVVEIQYRADASASSTK